MPIYQFKYLKMFWLQDEDDINPNIIIQIFSPIVASQRIMSCQFGNSYTKIQCQDGTNMVFDEVLQYLIAFSQLNWNDNLIILFHDFFCEA